MTLNRQLPLIWVGFIAINGQVLIVRELMRQFAGNELSIGIIFLFWLLWHAFGSRYLPSFIRVSQVTVKILHRLLLCLPILLLFTLLIMKLTPAIWHLTSGEELGIFPITVTSAMALSFFCSFSGLAFTWSSQWFQNMKEEPLPSIRRMYVLENIGAALGGTFFTLLLVSTFSALEIALLLCLVMLISLILSPDSSWRVKGWHIVMLTTIALLFPLVSHLEALLTQNQFHCQTYIASESSYYGELTATQVEEQTNFYSDGELIISLPDKQTAEETVHYALLLHAKPEKILLIGHINPETISEIFKHPSVRHVDGVDINPNLPRFIQSIKADSLLSDDRFQFNQEDIRFYLRRNSLQYDVVIMNLPSPSTLDLNRFYTESFFRSIQSHLKSKGILSVELEGSANMYGPELIQYIKSINNTVKTQFPSTILLPGERVRLIASRQESITVLADTLGSRITERSLDTKFVQPYYFAYDLSPERIENFNSTIEQTHFDLINRDLSPISFCFNIILWTTHHSAWISPLFSMLMTFRPIYLIFFVGLVVCGLFLFENLRNRLHLSLPAIRLSVVIMGFTEMSLEVIILLCYQAFRGRLNLMLAVILAGYMLGLALGAGLGGSPLFKKIEPISSLWKIHGLMISHLLCLGGLFIYLQAGGSAIINSAGLDILFIGSVVIAGILGGSQFITATRFALKIDESLSRVAGSFYALDLVGGALGALVTGSLLMPVLGMVLLIQLLICLNALAVGFLLLGKVGSVIK